MVVAAESARDGAPFISIDDVEVDPQTWRGVLLWLQDFTDADLSDLLDSVPTESEPQERAR
ncbi:MAG: hypothetical protein H0X61_09435 [Acidimicrobiia bacterium]|jgi:hypothetical protein|nr:hypothetical protein [Acidimicrobiia bacterium]